MSDHSFPVHQHRGLWWSVGFALAATFGAAAMTALAQRVASEAVYAFYIGAVAVTAWAAGRPAAIAVVAVCCALAASPILNGTDAGGAPRQLPAVRIASFAAVGLLVAQLTGALRRARNRAERLAFQAGQASAAKDRFLATMSHELRTPLNAILAYADLMMDGVAEPLSVKQREFTDRIRAAGAHLLVLVEDILDLARMEAGHLRVENRIVPLRSVVERAATLVEPQAKIKGIALHVEPPSTPVVSIGDPGRIRQIIVNLLANAVKFTGRGGEVRVAWSAERDSDQTWAIVTVTDTGVGIAPKDQTTIFEPFEQVAEGPFAASAGAGLGLAISRRLAQAMDGGLSVDSHVGEGSTFALRLHGDPVAVVPDQAG